MSLKSNGSLEKCPKSVPFVYRDPFGIFVFGLKMGFLLLAGTLDRQSLSNSKSEARNPKQILISKD